MRINSKTLTMKHSGTSQESSQQKAYLLFSTKEIRGHCLRTFLQIMNYTEGKVQSVNINRRTVKCEIERGEWNGARLLEFIIPTVTNCAQVRAHNTISWGQKLAITDFQLHTLKRQTCTYVFFIFEEKKKLRQPLIRFRNPITPLGNHSRQT